MSTVIVRPPVVNVLDILEYAEALLEEHGWRQGPRVPNTEEWDEVAQNGLSLHDAIGMACYRLSGFTGTQATPAHTQPHSKDFPTYGSRSSGLRTDATAALAKHLGGITDIQFNDQARDVGQVLAVLAAAIDDER